MPWLQLSQVESSRCFCEGFPWRHRAPFSWRNWNGPRPSHEDATGNARQKHQQYQCAYHRWLLKNWEWIWRRYTSLTPIQTRWLAWSHGNDQNGEKVPNATATGGSTGTDLNGAAVMNACRQIAQHLRPLRLNFTLNQFSKENYGRESSPKASWEEIIGKAYQTRTQLAAFGFYNTSPLDYE